MIVIGVDPGLARLGYGVIEVSKRDIQPVCYGIIETSGKDHRASERLLKIYTEIGTLFDKYYPGSYIPGKIILHKKHLLCHERE